MLTLIERAGHKIPETISLDLRGETTQGRLASFAWDSPVMVTGLRLVDLQAHYRFSVTIILGCMDDLTVSASQILQAHEGWPTAVRCPERQNLDIKLSDPEAIASGYLRLSWVRTG